MSAAPGTEVLVFSGFSLDPRQRLLFGADGRTVPLTGRAFDTLLYLAEHPHQLIDKQSLMKAVWPNVIVEENNLNQNISIVRRALGETPGENRFVVTVPGRGFRFAPAVTRQVAGDPPAPPIALAPTTAPAPTAAAPTGSAEGPAPEPAQSNAPPASTAALTPAAAPIAAEGALRTGASRSHTRLAWISGSIAGAVVLLVAGYILSRQLWPPSRSVAEVKSSIAVMPFANLTGDAGNDYLGDGMAEEIINVLAKVPGFKVPARTSSFAYKGRNTDIRQIGKDLGVDAVLEGSVRSAGEHIRITAELINAHDGLHVWAQTYDRKFTDLFALQDELAHAIVRTLRGSLSSQASGNLNREHPLAISTPTRCTCRRNRSTGT